MTSLLPVVDSRGASRTWGRFLVCCYVGIFGVRAFLIEKFAASVAWGDDLDGIARRILLPWENGTLTWQALFAAHNGDHRIVATRLWEIFWFVLNGSWDPKLVMTAKALIFAGAAVIFIHLLAGALGRGRFAAGALLAVLFAFPFGFHNLVWAFQSQFDFFLLAAALGWLALLRGHPVVALCVAAGSILTLASGPIVAASYVPYFVFAWRERVWSARKTGLCCAAAAVIMMIGMASPTKEAMPHTGTPSEKATTLVRVYAWPFSNLISVVERLPESARYVPGRLLNFPSRDRSWLLRAADTMHRHPAIVSAANGACMLLMLTPTLWVAWRVGRRLIHGRANAETPPISRAAEVGPLAIAGFAFLMIAATAVARANQITIAPRFLDHVQLAGFASLACAFILAMQTRRARRWLAAWGVVLGLGYAATMVLTLAQLSRRTPEKGLSVLQRYFATQPHNHEAMIEGGAFRQFIMSDDPTQFMSELDQPGMERVLPRVVFDPTATTGTAARIAAVIGRAGLVIALLACVAASRLVYSLRRHANVGNAVALGGARVAGS